MLSYCYKKGFYNIYSVRLKESIFLGVTLEILALTDGDRVVETQWLLMTSIGISCEYVHNDSALRTTF